MISMYKWKRYGVYISLAAIPMLVFIMLFFTIGLSTVRVEGMLFLSFNLMNILVAIGASLLSAVVIILIGNRLLQHPFLRMMEGKGLLTFILDSTGLIGTFNVAVNAPKMTGKVPGSFDELDDTYDIDMMHRLLIPQDATLTKAWTIQKDADGNIVPGESKNVLVLPDGDKKYDNLFSFENRPVFIFNKVMGKFLSRGSIAALEKDILLKHNALNILRKVQEIDTNFRNFGRYIGEQLHPKSTGLFSNKWVKWILIGVVVAIVIFIVIMFVPSILSSTKGLGNLVPKT